MGQLGNGLTAVNRLEETLSVKEAELSMERRLGGSERNLLIVQSNLAMTYGALGRLEEALRVRRDVYSGTLRLHGEEHEDALAAAVNYSSSLVKLERFEQAKSLLRRTIPVARRVLGECDELTLRLRWIYAMALYRDDAATLDDLCEAVTSLEELAPIARRVMGGAHPTTTGMEGALRESLAALRAREETPPPGGEA